MVTHIAYCKTCEREVELKRKNFDHMYHEIICFMVLTGIGFIIYLILRFLKNKNTCPNCESEFDLTNLSIKLGNTINSSLKTNRIA